MNKDYWEHRYAEGNTGWDVGYAATPIQQYIDQLTNKHLKILIPGAGNGHEAAYLFSKGFEHVYVLDIAKQPLTHLAQQVPYFPKSQLLHQDFFELEDEFDLIIEHTFFCALLPEWREKYVSKMFNLLKPKGKLVGLLFDFPLTEQGPPFGGNKELYEELFSSKFDIQLLDTAHNSIKPRAQRELFVKMYPKK
ncbi:thiopurine S-methyltransferase [Pustulibacterium marinum]|uniref:Thiopurine S-methyltransferase n=1 Tax=Pustulibacterium marinum TaxID=1224947 RepID=A0A1I7FRL3_9FLAO|nr:methyltransferase domain-containing protein [Pustulibacterium marinum]SFU38788.1 thiopurine S-methyltransferase [Pustulibacterium marinum]